MKYPSLTVPARDARRLPAWRLTIAMCLLLPTALHALAQPQDAAEPLPPATTSPTIETADAEDAPIELEVTATPRTPERIDALIASIDAELSAMAPTTQPATTQPSTQPAAGIDQQVDGWRLELWKHLRAWREQLTDLKAQMSAVELLSSDEKVKELTEKISDWKRRTTELNEAPLPEFITEEDIAQAEATYKEQNQAIDSLNAVITQQESLLAGGFAAQRAKLQEDIDAARTRLEELEASRAVDLKAADSEDGRKIIELRRRAVAARLATMQAVHAGIDVKEKRAQRQAESNRLRRDAMRPHVVALRERMNGLIEQRSRSEAEWIRMRLKSDSLSPSERALLELDLLVEEATATLQKDFANSIRDRFQQSSLSDLSSNAERDRAYWEAFSTSLSRRTASDVLEGYEEAREELATAEGMLDRLQRRLGDSVSEQRRLEDFKHASLEKFDKLTAVLRQATKENADEDTIKQIQNAGQSKIELRKAFDDMLQEERALIERLREGIAIAGRRVKLWESAVSRLYWAHLITRGSSILDPRSFVAASPDVKELAGGAFLTSMQHSFRQINYQVRDLTWIDWAIVAATLAVAAWLIALGTRWCSRTRNAVPTDSQPKTEGEEPAAPEFVERLKYNTARAGAVYLTPLALPLILALLMLETGMSGKASRVMYLLLGIIWAPVLAAALLNLAFKAAKPRFRLITCSNIVARYYRRFGFILTGIVTIMMGASLLLRTQYLAPTLAALLADWCVLAVNVLAVIFLLQRNTVLNIFPRAERGRYVRTLTTLRASYPAMLAVAIALVLMHLVGYRALASYLTLGITSSVALLLLAWVLHELLVEFAVRVADRARDLRETYAEAGAGAKADAPAAGAAVGTSATATASGAAAPGAPATAPAAKAAEADEAEPEAAPAAVPAPTAVSAVAATSKWVLTIGVFLAALSVWGVRPYEIKVLMDMQLLQVGNSAINLWRIGGALVAVIAAIAVSNIIRQTLRARVFPYHPAIDRGAQAAINTLLHYIIVAIGVYIALRALLLDFGALAVLFGGLGLGLGLGLQPLVVNFISGLLMLFERHVKVGDTVGVHGKTGEVTKVSMRSTTIRTPDGIFLVIPNGEFINQKVENWTMDGHPLRAQVEVGVSYGSNPHQVRDILMQIARRERRVLRNPPPDVFFLDFGTDGMRFSLVCWFRNPGERWFGMLDIRYKIFDAFKQAGIEIPLPQRTFHISGDKPLDIRLADSAGVPFFERGDGEKAGEGGRREPSGKRE